MEYNKEYAKKVYAGLSKRGYTEGDLGSEDLFVARMGKENNRRLLYDMIARRGDANVGSWERFNERMSVPDIDKSQYTFTERELGLGGYQLGQPIPIIEKMRRKETEAGAGTHMGDDIYKTKEGLYTRTEVPFRTIEYPSLGMAQMAARGQQREDTLAAYRSAYNRLEAPGEVDERTLIEWGNNMDNAPTEQKNLYTRIMGKDAANRVDLDAVMRSYDETKKSLEGVEDPEGLAAYLIMPAEQRVKLPEAERNKYEAALEEVEKAELAGNVNELHNRLSSLMEQQRRSDIKMREEYEENRGVGGFLLDALLQFPVAENPRMQGTIPSSQLDISPEGVHSNEQNAALTAAGRKWNEMKHIIDAAANGDIFDGLDKALSSADTWSSDQMLRDGMAIQRVVDKFDKNGREALTENEKALLDAIALNVAVSEVYGDEISNWYKGGEMVGEMVPYVIEMLMNPLSGVGRKAAEKITRAALKKYGKELVKKKAGRFALKRGAAKLGASVAGATGMALTTGLPDVGADIQRRMLGDATYGYDNDGNIEYTGHVGGEDLGTSAYKAVTSRMLDNVSEMLGAGYAKIPFKWLQKVGKGTKVLGWMDNLANSKTVKKAVDFMEKTKWNGPIEEFLEEVHVGLINPVLVGDHSWEEFFTADNLATIAIGVAVPGAAISALNTIGGAADGAFKVGAQERWKMQTAAARGAQQWKDNPGEWRALEIELSHDSMEDIEKELKKVYNNPDLTPEQKKVALEYAVYSLQWRTAQGVKEAFNEGKKFIDPMLRDIYGTAYEQRIAPMEANKAYRTMTEAEKNAQEILGIGEKSVDEWLNGRTAEEAARSSKEKLAAIKAYQAAKLDFEGRRDRFIAERDIAYMESDRSIQAHDNNGMVYATQYEGQPVYITGGDVVLLESGKIDFDRSSESLYVKFPDGHVEMIAPENFSEVFTEDRTEDLKAAARAEIDERWKAEFDTAEVLAGQQEVEQEKRDSGVVFDMTDPEGSHRVEILNEGEDMSDILLDGKEEQIPTEELNRWKQEAGIQSAENGVQSVDAVVDDATDNGTPTESEANVAPTGDNVAPVAPVENNEPAPVDPKQRKTEVLSRIPMKGKQRMWTEANPADVAEYISLLTEDPAKRMAVIDGYIAKVQEAQAKAEPIEALEMDEQIAFWNGIKEMLASQENVTQTTETTEEVAPVEQPIAQEEVPVNEPVGETDNSTVSQTSDQVAEGNTPGQSGVYSLSELTDNEGNRFYQKNGSIDLWDLSPLFVQARRQNAPIRLTERNIDHILDEHKKELGDSEESVLKFLDDVFSTAKVLRKARSGGIFVVVENTKTDKAAIIRLYPSKYGDYYNVESAGYYRKNKWKDTENVIAELSEPTQSVTASDVSKPQVPEEGGKELLNAETATTSASEDRNSVSNSQENAQKSGENTTLEQIKAELKDLRKKIAVNGNKLKKMLHLPKYAQLTADYKYFNEYLDSMDDDRALDKLGIIKRAWNADAFDALWAERELLKQQIKDAEERLKNAESRKEKEESTPEIQEPRSVEEMLDNGDKRITNYNSRGEVATVAIERDGKVVSVDSYDEGVLFEHTEYDGNGKASSVTRYDKQGNVVGTQVYEDGKAKTPMQKLADQVLARAEEKRRIPLRERARELEAQVGVKANIIESIDEVKNREARERIAAGEAVAGWYSGGQVYLYMPNIKDRREIELTYVHEVVAHHGVKKLLGDRFNEFLDGVWNMMSEADRARMLVYVGANENPTLQDMRAAADEYVAELAEKMNLNELEQSTWDKIVDWFKELLENIGFENLTKEDIESMLKASYANLRSTEQRAESKDAQPVAKQTKAEKYRKMREDLEGLGMFGEVALPKGYKWSDGKKYGGGRSDASSITALVIGDDLYLRDNQKMGGIVPFVNLNNKNHQTAVIRNFRQWPSIGDFMTAVLDVGYQFDRVTEDAINEIFTQNGIGFNRSILRPMFRISRTPQEFDATQAETVEKRGIIAPGLNEAVVNVVDVPRHDFTGRGIDAIHKAEEWANKNIAKEHTYHEGQEDEFKYTIDDDTISKFLSKSSTGNSDNLGVHLAALKELPNIINNSIDVEVHPDYQKKDGARSAENGVGRNDMLVHRMYGAVSIDGKVYRAKTTIHELRDKENKAYDYKITEIELIVSGSSTSNARTNSTSANGTLIEDSTVTPNDGINNPLNRSVNSISATKLLEGVEKSYDKGKKVLVESENSSENPQDAESGIRFRIRPMTKEEARQMVRELVVPFAKELREEQERAQATEDSGTRFRIANENQDIFVSNAQRAIEGIQQNKATAEQWIAMLKKNGGLKAGEDAWLGLEEWLNEKQGAVTKQEILDFIGENRIQIEEVEYSENARFKGQSYYADRYNAGEADDVMPANDTRLNYTTEGLENKREIALVVPTIESWNASDEIHFGDAGNGRAVAWVRFGETTDSEGNRVLVIDEIQSKRHQDGREKGYKNPNAEAELEKAEDAYREAIKAEKAYNAELKEKYGYDSFEGSLFQRTEQFINSLTEEEKAKRNELKREKEELAAAYDNVLKSVNGKGVPAAPFEKNWHELAMKRMLRLAAEEGFDKVAWTTGEQQAERYNMSKQVERIDVEDNGVEEFSDGTLVAKNVALRTANDNVVHLYVDADGVAHGREFDGKSLAEIVGKELAENIMQPGDFTIEGDGLRIGGEGMKGFYDRMLPSFVQKYTKKWGAKVGEVTMPSLEENNTMWSVDVTPEMQESVMQGQTMFRIADDVITTVDDFNSTHKGAAPTVIIDSADTLEEQLRAEGFSKEDIAESLKDYDSEFAYYHPTYDKVVINDHDVPKDELIGYLWHENAHRAVRELYTREEMERLCDYIYKDDMPRVREVLSEMGYKPEELAEEAYVRGIEDVFSKKDYRRRLERGGLKPKEDATEEEKVIIDSVNRIVDFINNGREEERADGRRAGGDYAERSTQENRRGQDEEVRNSQETGENTQAEETRFRTVEETTDGSIDDVPAQPLTLMERIANSLLEVSAKNKENLELRASALRTFGRDINRVLSLMKAQREYDKSTVDTLVKLAKMYFKNAQLLGEVDTYTMGRVLSLINNVVGKRDVTASAAKLMDILLDAHTKALAGILDKAEKVKAKKVNAAGVEVMGRLDKYGQRRVDEYRAAKEMTPEKLEEAIYDSDNRLAELEQRVREALNLAEGDDVDLAAKEYTGDSDVVNVYMEERARLEGLVLAREYKESIQQVQEEIKDLKRELKQAEEDYRLGNIDGKSLMEFRKSVAEAIMESKAGLIEGYHSLIYKFQENTKESSKRAKAFAQAQIDRAREIQHNANSDMEGIPADTQGKYPERFNSSVARALMAPMATFQGMMKKVGEKNVEGKGYLYERFVPQATQAGDNEFRGKVAARVMIEAKLKEIFGKKMSIAKFMKSLRKDGVTIEYREGNKMKTFALTRGQMLYIYMVNKMADGQMKLRRMGITDDVVAGLMTKLPEEAVQFADWAQDVLLKGLRGKYNAVHERVFGAPMAAIENYFPIKIRKEARGEKGDVSEVGQEGKPSTVTGSIIKRTKNATAIDLSADAMQVLMEHIDDMEHWAAFAEFNRDLNVLLNYKHFQNQVKNMTSVRYGSGTELWKNFKRTAQIVSGTYRPSDSSFDRFVQNITKGVTRAKINFRVFTAIKQLLSAPAFWTDAGVKELAYCYVNPKGSFEWAKENLPGFAERWQGRTMGNEKLLKSDSDWEIWRNETVEKATRWGMTPNAFIDALTVAQGARAVYMTKLKQFKKAGYTEQRANEKALQAAAEAYNESQQSSEGVYLSPLQVEGTAMAAMVSTFKNSNFGYTRKTAQAAANIKRKMRKGYKEETIAFMTKQMMRDGLSEENAKRFAEKVYYKSIYRDAANVAMFGFGLNLLWEAGGMAIYLFLGDDDEEKEKMKEEIAMRAALGVLQGIPFGDTMISAVTAVKEGDSKYLRLPELIAVTDIKNLAQVFDYDTVRAANDVLNILVSMGVGVTPQVFTDVLVAIADIEDFSVEELGMFAARLVNAPQSNLDRLMVDDAMENSAINAEEIMRRYAEYKKSKNAPITQFFYPEEEEKKVIERYEKRFEKLLDERLENVVEDNDAYDLFYEGADARRKSELAKMRQKYLAEDKAKALEKLDSKELVDMVLNSTKKANKDINEEYFNLTNAEDEDTAFIIKSVKKALDDLKEGGKLSDKERGLLSRLNELNYAINTAKRLMEQQPERAQEHMNNIRKMRAKAMELINNYRNNE